MRYEDVTHLVVAASAVEVFRGSARDVPFELRDPAGDLLAFPYPTEVAVAGCDQDSLWAVRLVAVDHFLALSNSVLGVGAPTPSVLPPLDSTLKGLGWGATIYEDVDEAPTLVTMEEQVCLRATASGTAKIIPLSKIKLLRWNWPEFGE